MYYLYYLLLILLLVPKEKKSCNFTLISYSLYDIVTNNVAIY